MAKKKNNEKSAVKNGGKKKEHQSVTNGFNNVMSDVMEVFRLLQQRFLLNISKGLLFSQTKKVQPNLSFA